MTLQMEHDDYEILVELLAKQGAKLYTDNYGVTTVIMEDQEQKDRDTKHPRINMGDIQYVAREIGVNKKIGPHHILYVIEHYAETCENSDEFWDTIVEQLLYDALEHFKP